MTSSVNTQPPDAVILLGLLAALPCSRASQPARPLIAAFAFACAWALTAVFAALHAPDWTMAAGGGVIVVSIVVVTVTVHLWTQAAETGESGQVQRGDDGGGGPRRGRPDASRPGGGGNDPSWWPESERQVALYVAERERLDQAPAVLPAESAPCVTTQSLRPHCGATLHGSGVDFIPPAGYPASDTVTFA